MSRLLQSDSLVDGVALHGRIPSAEQWSQVMVHHLDLDLLTADARVMQDILHRFIAVGMDTDALANQILHAADIGGFEADQADGSALQHGAYRPDRHT